MELNLKDKTVFITASTKGIGLATAKAFLREGAYVTINGRDEDRLFSVCDGLQKDYGSDRVIGVAGDASNAEVIRSFYTTIKEKWSYLDVLVCNLGSGKGQSNNKYDTNEWKRLYDINLFGSIEIVNCFLPLLNRDKASVVMTSSLASIDRIGAPPAYSAAKSSINTLVNHLASDLADKNIRVNCVAPGNIFYEGGRWDELMLEDKKGTVSYISENVPMKRFGTPEEIADAIAFLASDRASFITGTVLKVDGGQSRRF